MGGSNIGSSGQVEGQGSSEWANERAKLSWLVLVGAFFAFLSVTSSFSVVPAPQWGLPVTLLGHFAVPTIARWALEPLEDVA